VGGPGFGRKDGWFAGATEIPFAFKFDSDGLWFGQSSQSADPTQARGL